MPRIERFIEANLKGKNNFHKVLIIEAEAGATNGDNARAKIELKPLTDAQQQDALFQVYDERNIDKVGSAFRLPRMLRGESKDHSAERQGRDGDNRGRRRQRGHFLRPAALHALTGTKFLYVERDGARTRIAEVARSAVGTSDNPGEFRRGRDSAELMDMGVSFPPYHGLCRSTTVPI